MTVLRSTCWVVCRVPLNWGVSAVFHITRLGLWVWEGKPQRLGARILLREHAITMPHYWCCPPGSPLFPCCCWMYPIVWKYHYLFIHQLMDIWCISTFLAIGNHAAMNIYVAAFVWTHISRSFGYLPGNGIVGSYGNSMLNILRNLQTVFHSVYTILHPHWRCLRVPASPHPHHHLLLPFW